MQKILSLLRILFALGCIVLLVWAFNALRRCSSPDALRPSLFSFDFTEKKEIAPTPAQIRSIERIGQWEFLSIEDEELVDTVRRRLMLPDQYLARIYKGTLRLGIDLSQAPQDWVTTQGDTVIVTLPPVKLLNPQFIDEARTQTFHETGSWDAQSRERMYQKAHRRMLLRNLSEENLRQAHEVGKLRMKHVFQTLGFPLVVVK